MNRGGAAIFGQQRGVQVDPAEPRDSDQTRRNNLSVGDDHDGVRRDALKVGLRLLAFDFFRLVDGNSGFQRGGLGGRNRSIISAAARTVRLTGPFTPAFLPGLADVALKSLRLWSRRGETRR